jgi:hypothetical protein
MIGMLSWVVWRGQSVSAGSGIAPDARVMQQKKSAKTWPVFRA